MSDTLHSLNDQMIVLDTDSRMSYIGRMTAFDDHYIVLEELTVFDEKIIRVTLEEFLHEGRKNGFPVSRGRTLISRPRIISISPINELPEL